MLHEDIDVKPRKQTWNCKSVISMMNYLASTSRPDIVFSVHQAARLFSNPKRRHEEAVKGISRHLKRTSDRGIARQFDATRPIEVFVDADFAGTWN